jgi:hypothetical protein
MLGNSSLCPQRTQSATLFPPRPANRLFVLLSECSLTAQSPPQPPNSRRCFEFPTAVFVTHARSRFHPAFGLRPDFDLREFGLRTPALGLL